MGSTSRTDTGREPRLPEDPTAGVVGALEERIDEALAIARSAEAAAVSIGDAALDAAEQARRAAELAQRASAAMNAGQPGPRAAVSEQVPATLAAAPSPGDMESFSARADRVAERLHRLQRLPLSA